MYSRQKVLWAAMLLVPVMLCVKAFGAVESDTEKPDVTARVARVTFVSGDVQVRRSGNTDWERVTPDLPIVEGDEIATGADARVEIQLDSFGRLRLEKNSNLRISTLRDEGIAVSVPQGSLSVRFLDFDKDKSYFEIDAPKTTVAIQKAGMYRIDAGSDNDQHVRVTATESGEARVYSDNSGFTLRNGRSATIAIDGDLAGEWETADAANFTDDFDAWALGRDAAIAKKLDDAHYDKYYDRDIYGAEDLNNNGEWIHTDDYGDVWRPYQNVTGQYADWSPYRYGEWRWVPPFGWTWVNDEPWGWATYHHGRWFYDNGYWYWSPYGYYRGSRSWWSPALVVLTYVGTDYCWYPLPYRSTYYDCNWHFHRGHHGRWDGDDDRDRQAGQPPRSKITGPDRLKGMPYYHVPVRGVVTTPGNTFGTGSGQIKKATPAIAKGVLEKNPRDQRTVPRLPKIGDISDRIGGRVKVEKPITSIRQKEIVTGVVARKTTSPLDGELRTRVRDNRPPAQPKPDEQRGRGMVKGGMMLRDTGAVGRPVTSPPTNSGPGKSIPRSRETGGQDQPVKGEPRYNPPTRTVEQRREEPRYNPPPPSKSVEPRSSPPKQEQPKSQPAPRSQPSKESKPARDTSHKKDG